MYWDLVIIAGLILMIAFFFKHFSSYIYLFASIDLFLRIMTYVKNNLGVKELSNLIDKSLPESLPVIIEKYTSGNTYSIVMWLYVAVMTIFLFYTIRTLWRKN